MTFQNAKRLNNRDQVTVLASSESEQNYLGIVLGEIRIEEKAIYLDVLLDNGQYLKNLNHKQIS